MTSTQVKYFHGGKQDLRLKVPLLLTGGIVWRSLEANPELDTSHMAIISTQCPSCPLSPPPDPYANTAAAGSVDSQQLTGAPSLGHCPLLIKLLHPGGNAHFPGQVLGGGGATGNDHLACTSRWGQLWDADIAHLSSPWNQATSEARSCLVSPSSSSTSLLSFPESTTPNKSLPENPHLRLCF